MTPVAVKVSIKWKSLYGRLTLKHQYTTSTKQKDQQLSWPEFLSVCSCLRWNSLMKPITYFPFFFFLQINLYLFCTAVLTCYMYILTAVSP